jgi:16S rRNA A1518/A1519 N6-dimethyltransferase RsmA/KsgA/DIM1 with predicted DNA glycosylase/AP lyase activity
MMPHLQHKLPTQQPIHILFQEVEEKTMSSQLRMAVSDKAPQKAKGILWGIELARDLCAGLPEEFAERHSLKLILQDALIAAHRLNLEIHLCEQVEA